MFEEGSGTSLLLPPQLHGLQENRCRGQLCLGNHLQPPNLENYPDLRIIAVINTELTKLYNTVRFGDLDSTK